MPKFFNDSDCVEIGKAVSIDEVKDTVFKMPKDKSPGPDGWTQELFQSFFEILGEDLHKAIEESRISGFILGSLNATFFALIPKVNKPGNFHDFRPIALCNFVYKVISKIIATRIKTKLAVCISHEQFGFLKDRLIFDVVGIAQECLHSAKTKNLSAIILKLDLKKSYDKVSWQFLRLMLTQIGLNWEISQWIMACITSVNTTVLINGSPTDFFKSFCGLRQGCPLSPLLFLLVVECLSRLMRKVVDEGSFHGLKVAISNYVSHLLFVDDVLILGDGNYKDWLEFKSILSLFCTTSGMEVNCNKSVFLAQNIDPSIKQRISSDFNIQFINLEEGMKYLGFFLKPNGYRVVDWNWLSEKIAKRISNWTFRWLSLGGRLVLVKVVLQSILVYWLSLAKVPASTLHKIQQLMANFLWRGANKTTGFHLSKWKNIAIPKEFGGWGIRNIFWIAKSLAAKSCWRGIFGNSLWSQILKGKYLKGVDLTSWIRKGNFKFPNASIIWKNFYVLFSYH
jgi:hypothetical protein